MDLNFISVDRGKNVNYVINESSRVVNLPLIRIKDNERIDALVYHVEKKKGRVLQTYY